MNSPQHRVCAWSMLAHIIITILLKSCWLSKSHHLSGPACPCLENESQGGDRKLKKNSILKTFWFYVCMHVLSRVQLCDLMDCSPPGSSALAILQARVLEWVAISSSRGSPQPRDWIHIPGTFCIGRQILYHQRHLGSPSDSITLCQMTTSFDCELMLAVLL